MPARGDLELFKHRISVFISQSREGLARLGPKDSEKRNLEFTVNTFVFVVPAR
jgi:hypothetical protein